MSKQRGITPEDLYQITWVHDPAPSPDGDRLVYVSRRVNEQQDGYVSRLMLLELDGFKERPFTSGTRDHSPAWSPNGTRLAFLREHEGKTQAWLIAADGGEAIRVTHLEQGVSSLCWSPDGSSLLVKSSVKPDAVAGEDANFLLYPGFS